MENRNNAMKAPRPENHHPARAAGQPASSSLFSSATPPPAPPEKKEALVRAVIEAVRAGAEFYLLPDRPAVAAVMGECAVPAPSPVQPPIPPPARSARVTLAPPMPALTRRQCQVLQQVVLGRGAKEIAYRLHLSEKTVAAHRGHIMERLGIHDLPGLVVYALRQGLIDLATYDELRAQ